MENAAVMPPTNNPNTKYPKPRPRGGGVDLRRASGMPVPVVGARSAVKPRPHPQAAQWAPQCGFVLSHGRQIGDSPPPRSSSWN